MILHVFQLTCIDMFYYHIAIIICLLYVVIHSTIFHTQESTKQQTSCGD